jgi:hypothetical protein
VAITEHRYPYEEYASSLQICYHKSNESSLVSLASTIHHGYPINASTPNYQKELLATLNSQKLLFSFFWKPQTPLASQSLATPSPPAFYRVTKSKFEQTYFYPFFKFLMEYSLASAIFQLSNASF